MTDEGRFAVFFDAVIDLRNAAVTWHTNAATYLEFPTKPGLVVRERAFDRRTADMGEGVELWNIRTGRVEATFNGRLIAHSALNGLMPIQHEEVLALVDTREAREVGRVPVTGEALSAVFTQDRQLHVLSRAKARSTRELAPEHLTLQSFHWPNVTPSPEHALRVSWRDHQPTPTTDDRSPPFLHLDEHGALGLGRLFHSGPREPRAPTVLYRVGLDASFAVMPKTWAVLPFTWPDGMEVPQLANAGVRPIPIPEVPPEVREVLAKLPTVEMSGLAGSAGSQVLTFGEGYLCHWSLHEALRDRCRRFAHDDASILDATHVRLTSENHQTGVWNLSDDTVQWQALDASRPDADRGASLRCELKHMSAPSPSSLAFGDGGQVRFVLYDLGFEAWAIALPDGRYTGSARASELLAFYDENGALLSTENADAARDPEGVRRALSTLFQCGP
jgi:hypothetical protein